MKQKDKKDLLKRSDLVIEGNVSTWQCSAIGKINGLYTGTFKFKCFLTPTEKLALSRTYRTLIGPNPTMVTEHDENLATNIAHLRYRVISGPPFWTSSVAISGEAGDIPDEEVLSKILDAAIDSELKYLALLDEKKTKALGKAKKAGEAILESKAEESEGDDEEELA